jgi:hypothetical protein
MCFTSRYIPQVGLPAPSLLSAPPFPLSWTTSLTSLFPFIPSPANVKLIPTTLVTLPISSAHNLPNPFTNLPPIPQNYRRLSRVQTNTTSLHWPPEDGPSTNNSPYLLPHPPTLPSSSSSASPTSPLKADSPSRTKRPRIEEALTPISKVPQKA